MSVIDFISREIEPTLSLAERIRELEEANALLRIKYENAKQANRVLVAGYRPWWRFWG